jgi:hexosaminidase
MYKKQIMVKIIVTVLQVFFWVNLSAQDNSKINVVPYPSEVKMGTGNFTLSAQTNIVYTSETLALENYLQTQIKNLSGIKCLVNINPSNTTKASNNIYLVLNKNFKNNNGYSLSITASKIIIEAQQNTSLFNGLQTLLQLIPVNKKSASVNIPQLIIDDAPRFAYRGMHLDVCRHFFPISFVKKYIDLLAMHKFNTFHWHLTDDQGWRIEIKKYPLLTQVGNCRAQTLVGNYGSNKYDSTKYCGYYTQAQIKEIVQYATDRFITVIPEIEMPGHAVAALASYPYLGCTKGPYKTYETWGISDEVFCAGNDSAYTFLQNVLEEVMPLFPSKYIHIGGDECPKERWKTCPVCQTKIKTENLKDEHELQSYFVKRIEKFVNSTGKKIIGWDEILEGGLAPNATVMSWRGIEGGIAAAKQGNDVIMTPGSHCYFDHSQSSNEDSITIGGYLPLEKVYAYEPVPASLTATEAKHILGAQGNVWTEYITNESKVEYMVLPRLAALSEVLWRAADKKNFEEFESRLPALLKRYTALGYNYSTAYYDLKGSVIKMPNNKIAWKLETKNKEAAINIRANGKQLVKYLDPIIVNETGEYKAITTDKNGIVNGKWISQYFNLNKASGKLITLKNEPNNSYSGSGAFTLVDGIQNTKGMAKSAEFLGFLGKDLEAIIDFGEMTDVKEIRLHTFTRTASWIYPPKQNSIKVLVSSDGVNFTLPDDEINTIAGTSNIANKITFSSSQKIIRTKYIKIIAENYGIIPSGNPGADNNAWLFVDEVEVY